MDPTTTTAMTISIGRDPFLTPAILLLCGLVAWLLASRRGRLATSRVERRLRFVHVAIALLAVAGAAGVTTYRAQLFWGIGWDAQREMLVLDRMAPLAPLEIPASEVRDVLEIAAPEVTWSGEREAVVRFEIRTRSGEVYRSAPTGRRRVVDAARGTLTRATDGKLQRFLVHGAHRFLR